MAIKVSPVIHDTECFHCTDDIANVISRRLLPLIEFIIHDTILIFNHFQTTTITLNQTLTNLSQGYVEDHHNSESDCKGKGSDVGVFSL